ncbi:MAG: hypothetical protein AUJ92_14680 [Armatimonadetes bacterium CG2_30_59_28]|nr:glycosyltransferase family 4 protein [Armatimonadota bacterium]OIO92305.1 MAG: hypothetical protein AUJ92_14680 [Armatimonadetes bacterium CG2_30_59_28]PIU65292.1 MAG: hypothetical protein COS85_09230 [Armatimonadetes bacterium CG07_land_8_20_14_0_80_59_28]PIX42676.1 MAG: hypothetical protein COZ56_08730 [Armatimonadetes bacterium CG_4_8_14_3_um_filter_58_9]PIY40160.1 MAG: hypothetical protein COZ05_18145 [Armatimonadetes bacterium CG_4_10_14_3_um_filter_59_10]PJB72074.1 MAG: hypothetical p
MPARILYVNHVSQMSGAEHSLLGLLTTLPRDRFEPIVALPDEGPLRNRVEGLGIETVSVPLGRLKRSLQPTHMLDSLNRIYRSRQALKAFCQQRDICLIHSNSTRAHFAGGHAARLLGLPAIWHCRDLTDIPICKGMLGRTATSIVAISEAVRLSLVRQAFSPTKIRVIHNGVDVDRFQPRPPDEELCRRYAVPENGFVFAIIGQIVPWKRHDLFLAAAARIAPAFPQARFWIIGDDLFNDHPEYCRQLRRRADEPDLRARVVFTGFIEAIDRVLSSVQAVVVPSDNEPFGRVVIECMAAAKPVIATRAGGPVEIIENHHTGILIPPDNINALTDAMQELLKRSQWRDRLGREAREHVCNNFSLTKNTTNTCQLYEELLRPDNVRSTSP